MAERIQQSTTIRVALRAYLSTDHLTAATGKTIAVTISKNGAAFGNPSAGATNATGIANGWYYVDLSTTDTDTAGPLIVYGTSAGVDTVELPYFVGVVNANLVQILASAITGTAAWLSAAFTKWFNVATPTGTVNSLPDAVPGAAGLMLTSSYTAPDNSGISTAASAATSAASSAGAAAANTATIITTLSGLVQAIWDKAITSLTTVGSIGKFFMDRIDVILSTRLASANIISTSGTAQSGSTTNIRLASGAPSVSLIGQTVFIVSGTGALQSSSISAYNTTTKDATTTWVTAPDATSVYVVLSVQGGSSGGDGVTVSAFSDAAATQIDEIQAKTDLIGSGTWTVVSPTTTNADGAPTLTLTAGDDYYTSESFQVVFDIPDDYPDITGATVVLNLPQSLPPITATSVSRTKIVFQIPRSATRYLLPSQNARYQVLVTMPSVVPDEGHQLRPIIGQLIVVVGVTT